MSKTVKKYADDFDATLLVDTVDPEHAYVQISELGCERHEVELSPKQVKKLTKQLALWMIKHGHVEARKPLRTYITFDGDDIEQNTPLAVTMQDDEGRIHEVVWERRGA